ncbi:hypothetical protein AVEN_36819-1 [Araneus ventricosus]|uniref:DUF19 domain-containing protein n=1 Tax=Araneus ventricosus TaxID=182803 RepID=A0A4Y2L733_ARAVE|nr:hypothetical protein AVEN_36819-1 [Araneus ventricosus]
MSLAVGRLIAVIAVCLSMNALLCLGRKKPGNDGNESLYECVKKQMCDCGNPERFGDCNARLTEQSQRWMVDQLNSCNLFEVEYGQFTEGLRKLCSFPDNDFKPCFDEANRQFRKLYAEVSTGMRGPDETKGFVEGRTCLESIIDFCDSSPDFCMSVG